LTIWSPRISSFLRTQILYFHALEVCSQQGAIQIHIYLTLPLPHKVVPRNYSGEVENINTQLGRKFRTLHHKFYQNLPSFSKRYDKKYILAFYWTQCTLTQIVLATTYRITKNIMSLENHFMDLSTHTQLHIHAHTAMIIT